MVRLSVGGMRRYPLSVFQRLLALLLSLWSFRVVLRHFYVWTARSHLSSPLWTKCSSWIYDLIWDYSNCSLPWMVQQLWSQGERESITWGIWEHAKGTGPNIIERLPIFLWFTWNDMTDFPLVTVMVPAQMLPLSDNNNNKKMGLIINNVGTDMFKSASKWRFSLTREERISIKV